MIEKRPSKIHGWGVYATQTIPKNTRIIDYAGEKISNQESLKRERRYIQRGHIWCFKLTNRTVIDAAVRDVRSCSDERLLSARVRVGREVDQRRLLRRQAARAWPHAPLPRFQRPRFRFADADAHARSARVGARQTGDERAVRADRVEPRRHAR